MLLIFLVEVAPLRELIADGVSGTEGKKFLLWISGTEIASEVLDTIPDEYVVDVLIFIHLIKKNSMKMFEAMSILRTVVDVKNGKISSQIDYPTEISARAFRVSQLYSKVYFALHACLGAVGVKAYEVCYIVLTNGFDFVNFFFRMTTCSTMFIIRSSTQQNLELKSQMIWKESLHLRRFSMSKFKNIFFQIFYFIYVIINYNVLY